MTRTQLPPAQAVETGVIRFSNGKARDENKHLCEEHAPVLMALSAEEKAWRLRVAAGYNQLCAARTLLVARASVDQLTQHEVRGTHNALHDACLWNGTGVEMLKLLLEAVADTNIKAKYRGSWAAKVQVYEGAC